MPTLHLSLLIIRIYWNMLITGQQSEFMQMGNVQGKR